MATFTQIDRAKGWLDKTGLKQTNQPLYQIILVLIDTLRQAQIGINAVESSSGSGSTAITSLTGDVVAVGPGAASATIQPNVVTYGKIQQVSDGQRLLGRALGVGNVEEIELGANLEIVGSTLEISTSGGGSGGGLAHNLLSATHPDTLPASPVIGDLIRAIEGASVEGVYYGFTIDAPVVEDIEGVTFGYTFAPIEYVGNYLAYYPLAFDFVPVSPPDTLLAFEYTDFFSLALVEEDFEGLRLGYEIPIDYLAGNNFGYYPPQLAFVPPPDPANEDTGNLWSRIEIGAEDQVLTVVDGLPEWADIPQILTNNNWNNIPFSAGDFNATGGTTPGWTVDSGDVKRWQYQYSYDNLGAIVGIRYVLFLETTSVTGSGPTQLQITIPIEILGEYSEYLSIVENGAVVNGVVVAYDAGVSGTTITITKVGGGAFDTTADATYLAFEISAVTAPI